MPSIRMLYRQFSFTLITILLIINLIKFSFCLELSQNDENSIKYLQLGKRQSDDNSKSDKNHTLPTYKWPNIDGTLEEAESLLNSTPPVLKTGYWTFNASFQIETYELALKDPKAGLKLFFKGAIEYENLWANDCFQLTNLTAEKQNQFNFLGRTICFPYNDPNLRIDNKSIAKPLKFGCWLRNKDGDPNKPIIDLTEQLLKKLRWDKKSALKQIKIIEPQLPPPPTNSSSSNSS